MGGGVIVAPTFLDYVLGGAKIPQRQIHHHLNKVSQAKTKCPWNPHWKGCDVRKQTLEAHCTSVCAQCLVASQETGVHLSLQEHRSPVASVAFYFQAVLSKETQPLRSTRQLATITGRVRGQEESSATVGGNANWHSHSENQYRESSKKKKKIN